MTRRSGVSRSSLYCSECGGRLALYVVGLCPRCAYDLTGEDDNRMPPQMGLEAPGRPSNVKDA